MVSAKDTVTLQKADGTWSFIIPRFFNGGTVIGGTKQPADWSTTPDLATRESLLNEGLKIAKFVTPSSQNRGSANVIKDVVGRRPTREGGMRIEVENPKRDSNGKRKEGPVVHAYGAGGRGFEISWGVAEEVAELVKKALLKKGVPFEAKL
jgi:glycine/D-amino acid oxidase-like deaminating enzyme